MFNIENDFEDFEINEPVDTPTAGDQHNDAQQELLGDDNVRALQDELALLKNRFAHLTADFQNYKKRAETDRFLWIDRSRCDVLLGVLSIVDNFDRALEEAKNVHNEALTSWIMGFEMIHKALYDYLLSQKVTPMTQLQTFDPNLHEAVMQVESADHQSGQIVKVFEKGFMYKDTVLRTAKVSVAA